MIDGNQHNDTHPLAYAAGGLGPNPNILNHDAAMKAVDNEGLKYLWLRTLTKCENIWDY